MIKQSRRKMFNLTVSEWEGNYPEHGSETYILRSTYFANAFNRIKYESIKELSIKILDVEDGFGERLVNIITKHLQQKINGSTSSSSDILEKISSVYEDLFIKLSYNGELISVENFSLVQKKWRKIKKVILESYRGQSIRILIRNMDKNISSEEVFIQFIKKDSHLGLGLKNIYGKYDSLSSIKAAKKVLTINKFISIDEVILLERLLDEDKEVKLILSKNETLEDGIFNFSGSYIINRETNWIKSAFLHYEEKDSGESFKYQFSLDKKI